MYWAGATRSFLKAALSLLSSHHPTRKRLSLSPSVLIDVYRALCGDIRRKSRGLRVVKFSMNIGSPEASIRMEKGVV